jgi:hypothetical protein
MMTYRQGTYPYGSKGYYSAVSGWGGGYSDDVDYSLTYPASYSLNQDPVHMVQGYRYNSSVKTPAYAEPEASTYSYGSLAHRPAVSSDLPNFSLSSMAASLPSAPSDRLPAAQRTSTSSAYRSDGLSAHYSSRASSSHSTETGYASLNPTFESPVSYTATAPLPSNVSRTAGHSEGGPYQSASSTAPDLYGAEHPPYRSVHESDSYIYDRLDSGRRDSQSSGGASSASVLSNGQVYIPDSHHPHTCGQGYIAATAATVGGVEGATTAAGAGSGSGAASRAHAARRRRSAGNMGGI